MERDTIAAISTGLIPGGIGIVRVSGPEAVSLCEGLVRLRKGSLSQAQANRLYYGRITDGTQDLDEALIAVLRAPHSYTAEDTVELQCHGGPLVLKRVLEAALQAGARLAEPGEFTRRAFLNGRLDLSEAEAVMDLISAQSELARKAAYEQLSGAFSGKLRQIRASLLEKTAYLEAALDDPEHYELEAYGETIRPEVEALIGEIETLLKSAENGRLLKEGVRTAIIGRPNVGKSSFLNKMLGFERAIVTQIPGTTRDTIEESFRFGGLVLNLADTAGIRESGDEVERIGIERAKETLESADLIFLLLDGSRALTEEDERLIALCRGKACLLLLNKADLGLKLSAEALRERTGLACFAVSALSGEGLEAVLKETERRFCVDEIRQQPLVVTSLRHKELLEQARTSLRCVIETVDAGAPEDLLTIDLMDAYRSLGQILGEEVEEDLINEIFGKFCMGK